MWRSTESPICISQEVQPDRPLIDSSYISQSGDYRATLRLRRAERLPGIEMDNITLVTHITVDRAERLLQLCRSWRGPMSVSLFRRLEEGSQAEVLGALDSVDTDGCIRKHVDVHIVEVVDEKLARSAMNATDMFTHYPFNVQRNAAIRGAVGRWVFLLDADFTLHPTSHCRERVVRKLHADSMLRFPEIFDEPQRNVAIVPAVETVTRDVSRPTTFDELAEQLQTHQSCSFYGHHCRTCHLPTNLRRFVSQHQSGTEEPYEVKYQEGFEPYVIVDRTSLPDYDERFIGRGWDKMSFFYELSLQKRKFIVLSPGPFLVHAGRGDMPTHVTEAYVQRQRGNRMMMMNFKTAMGQKYNVSTPTTDDPNFAPMEEEAKPRHPVDWSEIASSVPTQEEACVSRFRLLPLQNDSEYTSIVKRLEDALGFACKHIDCTPLLPGGVRYFPRNIIYHADWAFDRYFKRAVAHGQRRDSSCEFGGAAHRVPCMVGCHGCNTASGASKGRVGEAVKWLCGESLLANNCDGILKALGTEYGVRTENITVFEKANLLFSFHYNVHRCTMHDVADSCSFGGIGVRVPCRKVVYPE